MVAEIALVTVPNEGVAEKIAHTVLEEHLAACVNVLPGVRSFYRWEGNLQDDSELLMIIKTSSESRAKLEERVIALHPYDTPEFITFSASHVQADYLSWMRKELES